MSSIIQEALRALLVLPFPNKTSTAAMSNVEDGQAGANNLSSSGVEGTAKQQHPFNYGGNPLAQANTADTMLPAFGGSFQPGLYKAVKDQKIANPAPLGLSAFALTTFLLSLINLGTRGTAHPNIVVGAAYGYGGLIQLLAGMWYV